MTRQEWEYLTTFIQADAKQEEHFLHEYKDWKGDIPQHAPESLMPRLDHLGQQGWELVSMQPVYVGQKQDILMQDAGSGSRSWTSTYFCVFKRAK
jgi:hypothetical protein